MTALQSLPAIAVRRQPRPAAAGQDEAGRQAALQRYGLTDGEWEGSPRGLEAATRLASAIAGVSHAAVHIITETELVQISVTGAAPLRLPREGTMCNEVMHRPEPVTLIADTAHSEFADNIYVNGEAMSVRFYAAASLLADDGQPLGTVCAWSEGTDGRSGAEVEAAFADIGVLLADELEARRVAIAATRAANLDPLTQLPNRRSADARLVRDLADVANGSRDPSGLVVLLIDLIGFKSVNDTFGHAAGDAFLVDAARRLNAAVRSTDMVARWGGDEFLIIADTNGHPDTPALLTARIHLELGRTQARPDRSSRGANAVALRGSVGSAVAWPGATPEELVNRADQAMYATRAHR